MKQGKNKDQGNGGGRLLIESNKKARRDYEILDTIEAGISLLGSEVKSARKGGLTLRDSYVRLKATECFLVGSHIAPYTFSREDAHESYRDRKLLLHRREIERLGDQIQLKGLTVVPLEVYFNAQGRCKVLLGIGRGKKLYDKRQDMKAKDAAREMQRALKR